MPFCDDISIILISKLYPFALSSKSQKKSPTYTKKGEYVSMFHNGYTSNWYDFLIYIYIYNHCTFNRHSSLRNCHSFVLWYIHHPWTAGIYWFAEANAINAKKKVYKIIILLTFSSDMHLTNNLTIINCYFVIIQLFSIWALQNK